MKVCVTTIVWMCVFKTTAQFQWRRANENHQYFCAAHGACHESARFKHYQRVKEEHVGIVKQQTGREVVASDAVCDVFYFKFLLPKY